MPSLLEPFIFSFVLFLFWFGGRGGVWFGTGHNSPMNKTTTKRTYSLLRLYMQEPGPNTQKICCWETPKLARISKHALISLPLGMAKNNLPNSSFKPGNMSTKRGEFRISALIL